MESVWCVMLNWFACRVLIGAADVGLLLTWKMFKCLLLIEAALQSTNVRGMNEKIQQPFSACLYRNKNIYFSIICIKIFSRHRMVWLAIMTTSSWKSVVCLLFSGVVEIPVWISSCCLSRHHAAAPRCLKYTRTYWEGLVAVYGFWYII